MKATKDNLLDAISTHYATTVSHETLLAIYWDYMYRKLRSTDLQYLQRLAHTEKLLTQLHCGIEGHVHDCRCTTVYSEVLNNCQLFDDIT